MKLFWLHETLRVRYRTYYLPWEPPAVSCVQPFVWCPAALQYQSQLSSHAQPKAEMCRQKPDKPKEIIRNDTNAKINSVHMGPRLESEGVMDDDWMIYSSPQK